MSAATLHTLGYSGFIPETFVAKLQSAGIEVLIDVRRNPVSRKKGFSKASLAEFLTDRGIEYVHLPALGVPESLREELREGGDLGDYLAGILTAPVTLATKVMNWPDHLALTWENGFRRIHPPQGAHSGKRAVSGLMRVLKSGPGILGERFYSGKGLFLVSGAQIKATRPTTKTSERMVADLRKGSLKPWSSSSEFSPLNRSGNTEAR